MLDHLDRILVREALRDFRDIWPQLALTDLLARGLAVVVVVPAVGLLLKLFLLAADDGVLADTDIALFLVHPLGLTAGLVVGSVSLALLFAESGALMTIAFGACERRRVTWLDAVRYITVHRRRLVALAGRLLVWVTALTAPFLLVVVGIYRWFLGAHDINFYLANRPPELRHAFIAAGLVLLVPAILLLRLVAGWVLSLPLVLFEGRGGFEALGASARILTGKKWSVASLIGGWVAAFAVVRWLVAGLLGLLGGLLVPKFGDNLTLVAVGLGVTVALMGLANLVLDFLSTALLPLLLVRLYRRVAGPGRFEPPLADHGSLGPRTSFTAPGGWRIAAAAAVVVGVLATGFSVSRSLDEQDDALVIAHRGASGAAPENSMAAFERAITEDADWIELDVQEDAEGTVIVIHDSDFMKIGGHELKVWEATANDVRDLDIGSWFDTAFADQRVATLSDVLELARGRIGVVVELKYYDHDDRLEARVVEVVEAAGMANDVMLMSLKRKGLDKVAALRPDWPRGLLNSVSVGDLTRLDLDFLALNANAASFATIRRAHQRGMQVYAWTINDPVQMSVMLSRGVDGLITDEPALAREVMTWRDELGPFGRVLVWVAGEAGLLRGVDEASTAEDA